MAIYTGVTINFLGKRFGDWRFSWSYILGWVAMLMTFFAGGRGHLYSSNEMLVYGTVYIIKHAASVCCRYLLHMCLQNVWMQERNRPTLEGDKQHGCCCCFLKKEDNATIGEQEKSNRLYKKTVWLIYLRDNGWYATWRPLTFCLTWFLKVTFLWYGLFFRNICDYSKVEKQT